VLDAVAATRSRAWVAGGWGVDALVGRQTRVHRDLDLAIDAASEPALMRALAARGYRTETDWRPVRVELAADGDRWVDLHPLSFDRVGNGTQAGLDGAVFRYPAHCFVEGSIAGRPVGCLSVQQQIDFHSGYQPRDVDLADLALLRALARIGATGE